MRSLFLLLLIPSLCLGATSWYVDVDATGQGGAEDGTSWTDAWTNLSQINMPSLSGGDDVQIAEGTYFSNMTIDQDGASDSYIVFQLAQDTNYQGHVHVEGGINIYANYIKIVGGFDTNFVIPDSVMGLDVITNNIGFHLSLTNSGAHGINLGSSPRTGVNLRWLHLHDIGILTDGYPADGEPGENAISLSGAPTNVVIKACWFQDNIHGDTINGGIDVGSWGNIVISDCLIYNVGDDAVQLNGSFDMFRCKISGKTWGYASGHTDVLQTWGNKIRFHHNVIWDNADPLDGASQYNSLGLPQFSTPIQGDFLFYNNLYFIQDIFVQSNASPGLKLSHDAWWSPGKYNSNVVITNIVLANNLFCNPNAQVYAHTFHYQADTSRGTNESYTITNCWAMNNLFIDNYQLYPALLGGIPASFPSTNASGPWIETDTNRYLMSHNIISGANRDTYYARSTIWNDVNEIEAAYGFPQSTNQPSFIRYTYGSQAPFFDFRLTMSDVDARGQGTNLTAFVSDIPDIDKDLNWATRPTSGMWDIGPYSYSSDGLLLYFDFDDGSLTNGTFMQDISGAENHGHEFGHGSLENWPIQVDSYNGSYAGSFSNWYDPTVLPYESAGAYIGVTNNIVFTNLSELSVSVWVNWHPVDGGGSWSTENNQSIIDSGYGYLGGFKLGKNGTKPMTVYCWTNSTSLDGDAIEVLRWTDVTDSSGGSTNAWHHYVMTWDGTNFRGYLNGVLDDTSTEDLSLMPTLNMHGPIAVGCKTHYTTPTRQETLAFDDDLYPNHGWLHAAMDELRVYNKTLSADEVYSLYLGAGAGGGGGGESEVEPAPSAPLRGTTFNRSQRGRR